MVTAVLNSNPSSTATLRVDDQGRLLVAMAGGGGGGGGGLGTDDVNALIQTALTKYKQENPATPAPDLSAYIKKDGTVPFTGNANAGNKKLINLATPQFTADAATKGYVDSEITKAKQAIQAPTPAAPEAVILGSAIYDAYNSAAGGGVGASLAANTVYNANTAKAIKFEAQTTVTVPVAGWYRIDLSVRKGSQGGEFNGFFLNNAVTKFPNHTAPTQADSAIGNSSCTFMAQMAAGTAYRISMNTPETMKGKNAVLQVQYIGPAS